MREAERGPGDPNYYPCLGLLVGATVMRTNSQKFWTCLANCSTLKATLSLSLNLSIPLLSIIIVNDNETPHLT